MTPILLHDMPELPQWNIYLLFIFWVTQIFSTCLSELYVFVGLIGMAFGGTDNQVLEISFCIIMLLNFFPFLTAVIPYEIYQYRTRRLTASKYLRLQIIKFSWTALAMIPLISEYHHATELMVLLFALCIPYAGAAIYAWKIHKKFVADGGVYDKL